MVPRNFDFKPANEIFPKKCELPFFQKWWFWGIRPRKLSLNKIGIMDMSYIMNSGQKKSSRCLQNWKDQLLWIVLRARSWKYCTTLSIPIWTRIHNIGHIYNANFAQTQFSTSHPQKIAPFEKLRIYLFVKIFCLLV